MCGARGEAEACTNTSIQDDSPARARLRAAGHNVPWSSRHLWLAVKPGHVSPWVDSTPRAHPMIRNRNASVAFILVTVFLDTLGIGVVMPVTPRLVSSFLGDDLGAASGYYGAFVSVYAAVQFLCAPVLGGLS